MADEWDQFPDAGGTATMAAPPANDPFAAFPDVQAVADPFAAFPDAEEKKQPAEEASVTPPVPVWKQLYQGVVSAGTGIEKSVANTLKFAGRLSDATGAIDPAYKPDVENNPIYKLGRAIEEFSKKDAVVDPRLAGGSAEKIGGTVGTVLSYIPGGMATTLPRLFADGFESHKEAAATKGEDGTFQALAGGSLNLALGLPIFRIAKGVARALAPNAAPIIQDTVRKVYSEMGLPGVERLLRALESKAAPGTWTKEATDALTGSLRELDKEIKKPITAALRGMLSHAAQSAAIGGGVTTGHNLIAQTYDPDRPTLEGVPEALATFGVLGAIGAAAGARGRVKNAREAQEYLRQRFPKQSQPAEVAPPELPAPPAARTTESPAAPPTPPVGPPQVLKSLSELPTGEQMMESRIVAAQPPAPLAPVILHQVPNEEDGTEAIVTKGTEGKFNVSLRDVDSGNYLSTVSIFPTEAAALEYARTVRPPVEAAGPAATAEAPAAVVPFMADPQIPFLTKERVKEQMIERGMAPEQIDALTTAEVQSFQTARPAGSASTSPTEAPAPDLSADSQLTADLAAIDKRQGLSRSERNVATNAAMNLAVERQRSAETEYQRELVTEANAAQAGQGRELMEAVIDAGGLPSTKSPHRQSFSGELQRIEEAARDPERRERIPVNRLFRPDAPANDELVTRLRDQGFDLPTHADLQTMLEQRLRTGRPVFGTPESAAAADRPEFGARGLRGAEGGFISIDAFEALLNAGRKFYRKGMDFAAWAARMARRFGENMRQFLHHIWRSITGADVLPHARERGSVDISRPTIRVGNKRDGYRDVPLQHLDKIPIADLPALVSLTRELGMAVPKIRKLRGARGVFRYDSAGYSIDLDPRLFSDPVIAAKVLAHEIGHANDFLPDETLKRGNLLGRLATLKNYLVSTLPIEPANPAASLTTADRHRLRSAAQRYIGPRPRKGSFPSEFEAWNERLSKWYQRLVNEELQTRGLAADTGKQGVTNNVREELISLSDWWKPYLDDAAEGKLSDSHAAYRNSSRELYADMISVLLNSPRDVQERAPTAFKMFFNYLDRKPEVREAFFEMWDALGGDRGRLVAARRQKIHAMFKSGEELLNKKIEERMRTTTWGDWLAAMRGGVDTRYWPAIRRERAAAGGGNVVAQQRPLEWLFDSHPLADNQVYVAMHGANEAVRKPLLEAGLSERDLGEFLFFDRVANESYELSEKFAAQMESDHGGRAHIANPEGHTPETAREQLAHMELVLGADNFAKVQAAASRFHELFFDAMQRMRAEGMIGDEAWAMVEGNRSHYVTFQAIAYADLHVPAGIKHQMGYLGEIANPHTSTTLKWITALRAVEFNKAKRVTVQHLQQYFPGEITEAPMKWDGRKHKPQEPRDHDLALVTFMQEGKLRGVHVPREIAQMLEYTDSATVEVLHKILSPLEWMWQQVFYPSYITFSPLFQLFRNPVRDIRRTAVNLPNEAGMQHAIAIRWGETRKMVKQWVKEGKMHPDVIEALAARAVPTPMGTWQRQMGPHEDMFITIAGRFGLTRPGLVKEGHILERVPVLGGLFRALAVAGQVRELAPKLGAYRLFTKDLGYSTEDAAAYVRNWVGTPPWYKKGTWTRLANDIFPFSNVWMKGWQADARLMRGRSQLPTGRAPKSAASWWLRWMLTGALPKVLMAAGAAGIFGEAIRQLYSRIGDYWMQNYDVIPLGEQAGGDIDGKKTVFIPLPKDFTDRTLGGLTYLLAKASFDAMMGNKQEVRPTQVAALGTSDMPSVNPALKLMGGWTTYLAGGNPYDGFLNKHILTQQQEDAGWRYTAPEMLKWTWQQNGASSFVRWNGDAGTLTEMAVTAIPGLNGMVKWTDTGLREDVRRAQQEQRSGPAQLALDMPGEVQQLRHEYNWLKSVGEERRTPEMQYRFEILGGWNSNVYEPAVESAQMFPDAKKATAHRTLELSRQYQRPR